MRLVALVLLAGFYSSSLYALDCSDPDGAPAPRRWSLQELEPNGRVLNITIQAPKSRNELQQVLTRRSGNATELQAFDDSQVSELPPLLRSNRPLWQVTHQWTQADENDYADWISSSVDTDFMDGSGVLVDCADFAITLRWVYARNHGLPAADQLAGSGQLFGQWISTDAWDALPSAADWKRDERFKAALKYVLENTYTHSLLGDLYPVEIDRNYVTVGTIFLNLYNDQTGHTQTIKSIAASADDCTDGGCVQTIWGNEPADEQAYTSDLMFDAVQEGSGGFMRFRWPQLAGTKWTLTTASAMPGYSEEQYSFPPDSAETTTLGLLGLSGLSNVQMALIHGRILASLLSERVHITEIGDFFCSVVPCATTSGFFNDYSTPSRDARIQQTQRAFLGELSSISSDDPDIASFKSKYGQPLLLGLNTTLDDYIFDQGGITQSIVSDPRVSFFQRWGISSPTATENSLVTYQMWVDNWTNRQTLVSAGADTCGATPYADGSECSGASASQYSTSTIDQALRIVAQQLGSAGPDVESLEKSTDAGVMGCAWNDDGHCSIYDYIHGGPDGENMLAALSSNPNDSVCKRWGFKPSP